MSKINKKSWIRGNESGKQCPFGLPIPLACQHAGSATAHMCPLDIISEKDKKERIKKANKRVYIWYKEGQRCIYAQNIMEQKGVVNCDFGDAAQGMGTAPFSGSPLYAQTFSGIGLDGLYAFPLGFYADNNESRNLPHGLFSLLGEQLNEIVKNANTLNEDLWNKIDEEEELSLEEKKRLNSILENCKQIFEESRSDVGKINELVEEWS